jgi:hypothetical protein
MLPPAGGSYGENDQHGIEKQESSIAISDASEKCAVPAGGFSWRNSANERMLAALPQVGVLNLRFRGVVEEDSHVRRR